MADRPTPTGPAAPELAIVESRVYRGREHLVLRPGDPPRRGPRGARGLPHRHPATGFTDRLRRAAARPGEPHLLARGEGRLHRADARGHLARSRRRARLAAAAAGGRARPAPGQDPRGQGPDRASTTSSTTTPTRASAWPPGRLAVRLVNHLVQAEEGFDFAEELDVFLRRAERTAFGPSTGAILEEAITRDIPYIRLNAALPRPARPGRPRPADPRHDDLARPARWPSTSPATRT